MIPVPNHFKSTPDVDVEQAILDSGKGIPCGFAGTQDIANVAYFSPPTPVAILSTDLDRGWGYDILDRSVKDSRRR